MIKTIRKQFGMRKTSASYLKSKYGEGCEYINVDGVEVRLKISGEGEPVLLLHGFCSMLETWNGWQRELSAHYKVISFDMPPFGITGPLNTDKYTRFNDYFLFFEKLVDAIQLTEFHIAGNSIGGFTAWNYALKYPTRVKKMILIDSVGYKFIPPVSFLSMLYPIGNITKHITPKPILSAIYAQVYGNKNSISETTKHMYYDFLRRKGTRDALSKMINDIDISGKRIPYISTPTLILWGKKDTWVHPKNAHKFHKDISNSQLIIYPSLGHVPQEEDAATTVKDALRFLQTQH